MIRWQEDKRRKDKRRRSRQDEKKKNSVFLGQDEGSLRNRPPRLRKHVLRSSKQSWKNPWVKFLVGVLQVFLSCGPKCSRKLGRWRAMQQGGVFSRT
eukprot:2431796-Amphidinium_carterae.1